jgi:hypothetical protein
VEGYTTEETEQLYEQAKRVLRQMLPPEVKDAQGRPFILACSACGYAFRNDVEIGMAAEHAKAEHGADPDAEKTSVSLDLIFIGEGPPPRGNT